MSPNQTNGLTQVLLLLKGRDCDCCAWCENGKKKKNTHTLPQWKSGLWFCFLVLLTSVLLWCRRVTAIRFSYLCVLLKSEHALWRCNLQVCLSCAMTLVHVNGVSQGGLRLNLCFSRKFKMVLSVVFKYIYIYYHEAIILVVHYRLVQKSGLFV